jgi:hypothetical protein
MEVSHTQMPLLNQRLTMWGEIVKAQSEGHEVPALRESGLKSVSLCQRLLCLSKMPSRTSQGVRRDMVWSQPGRVVAPPRLLTSRERSTKSSIPVTLSSAAGRRDIRDEEDMVGYKR